MVETKKMYVAVSSELISMVYTNYKFQKNTFLVVISNIIYSYFHSKLSLVTSRLILLPLVILLVINNLDK